MSQLSIFDAMGDAAGIQSRPAPAAVTPRMVTGDVARKKFVSEFRHTAPYLRRWDVFSDFITLAASELDITRIRTPENIERSRKICDRYQPADLQKLKNLFCLLVAALEGGFQDFLGSVFMELELGSGDMGQFFTPYSRHPVSVVNKLAKYLDDDSIQNRITQDFYDVPVRELFDGSRC